MTDQHRQREQELRELNAKLDHQKEQFVRQASEAARAQEERLSRMPATEVDSVRLSRDLRRTEADGTAVTVEPAATNRPAESADADELPLAPAAPVVGLEASLEAAVPITEPAASALAPPNPRSSRPGSARAGGAAVGTAVRPGSSGSRPSSSRSAGPGSGSAVGGEGGGEESGLGSAADARYQKAQLAVTLEEVERLRALLAAKTTALAEAETNARELQQRVARIERAERAAQQTLIKERAATAEEARRADALERELGLLRKDGEESARREKSQGSEQRSKDVRLNRALEELQRTKTQLKQLRDEREDAGGAARSEAQRLAAENTRLRRRQSELLLAFKKQAKLIDVLKRQKLHVEAATMLSFTEEEFSRTLELGEALA